MKTTANEIDAGSAIYSQRTLRAYNFVVLSVSNRFIWKCPTRHLEAHYNNHISANHLDVGVGTGYFLDRCQFPSATPRLALMDLNPDALKFAATRTARYKPRIYRHNVLKPISLEVHKFDSVGINYLLHCIAGSIESKAIAFDHLKTMMNPNAAIFGSTLLQDVSRSWRSKRLMEFYNKKGIFSNRDDHLSGLQSALEQRFREVSVRVIGCAALFAARV